MSTNKIRVLVINSDRFGVGKFRSLDPHIYLQNHYGEEFHIDINENPPIEDDYFKSYQILHFHTFIHKTQDVASACEATLTRLQWCKENGIKTIIDFDDYWMPDQYHPLYQMVLQRKDNEHKIKVMKASDWVTVTTPIFAGEVQKRVGLKNVMVLPNAVDEQEEQFQSKPEKNELIRFGWLGGSSHTADIELLRQGITSAQYAFQGKIQFVLCGFDLRGTVKEIDSKTGEVKSRNIKPEETSWYQYEKAFTDDYKIVSEKYRDFLLKFSNEPFDDLKEPYRRVWTKSINTYAENYNKFDVALAPLKSTLFNSVKSQLKVVEAGFHKKALIASNWGPYTIDLRNTIEKGGIVNTKGNALLVDEEKGHKQWFQHISRLMKNPSMIEDLGNKLYETVKNKYSLDITTKTRRDFYLKILQ